jgi:hypothetical protein
MFRNSDFIGVGGFNENLSYSEDYDFALRLSVLRNYHVLKEKLYLYRTDSNGRSETERNIPDSKGLGQLLFVIESNFWRNRHLLSKQEERLTRIDIAHLMIICRSYRRALARTLSHPLIVSAFTYCLKNFFGLKNPKSLRGDRGEMQK